MDEIECACREFVGDEVELSYLAATIGQIRQVLWVRVHRDHSTTWQDNTAQPSRE